MGIQGLYHMYLPYLHVHLKNTQNVFVYRLKTFQKKTNVTGFWHLLDTNNL